MDDKIKSILNVAVVIVVILWLLGVLFGFRAMGDLNLPTVR